MGRPTAPSNTSEDSTPKSRSAAIASNSETSKPPCETSHKSPKRPAQPSTSKADSLSPPTSCPQQQNNYLPSKPSENSSLRLSPPTWYRQALPSWTELPLTTSGKTDRKRATHSQHRRPTTTPTTIRPAPRRQGDHPRTDLPGSPPRHPSRSTR